MRDYHDKIDYEPKKVVNENEVFFWKFATASALILSLIASAFSLSDGAWIGEFSQKLRHLEVRIDAISARREP